jgi:hypothetical protein
MLSLAHTHSLSLSFSLFVVLSLSLIFSCTQLHCLVSLSQPLNTKGDGNCLLHALSLALWGVHDRHLRLRTALCAILSPGSASEQRLRYPTESIPQPPLIGITFESYFAFPTLEKAGRVRSKIFSQCSEREKMNVVSQHPHFLRPLFFASSAKHLPCSVLWKEQRRATERQKIVAGTSTQVCQCC